MGNFIKQVPSVVFPNGNAAVTLGVFCFSLWCVLFIMSWCPTVLSGLARTMNKMAAVVCTLWAPFLFLNFLTLSLLYPQASITPSPVWAQTSEMEDRIESESVRPFLWQIIRVTELCSLFSSSDWSDFPPSYAVIDLHIEPCCCFIFLHYSFCWEWGHTKLQSIEFCQASFFLIHWIFLREQQNLRFISCFS